MHHLVFEISITKVNTRNEKKKKKKINIFSPVGSTQENKCFPHEQTNVSLHKKKGPYDKRFYSVARTDITVFLVVMFFPLTKENVFLMKTKTITLGSSHRNNKSVLMQKREFT